MGAFLLAAGFLLAGGCRLAGGFRLAKIFLVVSNSFLIAKQYVEVLSGYGLYAGYIGCIKSYMGCNIWAYTNNLLIIYY